MALVELSNFAQQARHDCAPYEIVLSEAGRRSASRLIAAQTRAPDVLVQAVVGRGPWRLVWAKPGGMEPGVFIFQIERRVTRLVDTWGGLETDRRDSLRYAEKLGIDPGLAGCFASRLIAEGP